MASLFISYLSGIRQGIVAGVLASEVVTTSSTSAAGGAIPSNAIAVQLVASADSYGIIGTGTPTSSATNGIFLPANVPVYIDLSDARAGGGFAALKVASRTVA